MSAKACETYAGEKIPPDLETAYSVQSQAVTAWPDELVGFKVGGIPAHFRRQFPAEWIAGPVFAHDVHKANGMDVLDYPVFENGFAAFEPELIFLVNRSVIGQSATWTPETAKAVINRVYFGAEIASSPNLNVNNLGPGSIISDFGNNAGIVLGPEIDIASMDAALNVIAETIIDGESVGRATPQPPPAGPLGALSFLLKYLSANPGLYDIPEQFYVSSGAITGVHQSHVGALGNLIYEGFTALNIRFVPRTAIKEKQI